MESLFLRFLPLVARFMLFELGNWGSGGGRCRLPGRGGEGSTGLGGLSSSGGGGEWDGCDEGGEKDVISSDGDRCRFADDEWELGEGESSGGGGGGGSTNSKVRDAI